MKKSTILKEGALFSGFYIILFLITVFVPGIGTVTMFLLPIPVVLYSFRYGLKPSLIMFFVILILTALFATVLSLPITILAGLGGIVIGLCLHYKKSVYETWALGAVAVALGFVFVFIINQVLFDINLVTELNGIVDSYTAQIISMFEQYGNIPEETLLLMEEQLLQVKNLLPVLLGIIGILYSFISLWVGFKLINRLYKHNYKFPPFYQFRLPVSIIWYYLISFFVFLMVPEQDSIWNQAASNVSMLIGLLLVLQRLSFIAYYIHIKNKSKGLLITAIVLLMMMPPLFIFPDRILGIIDL